MTFTADNQAMIRIAQKLGFTIVPEDDPKYVLAAIEL
jgi:RimJ/RimL family protein N-acetyltransferase